MKLINIASVIKHITSLTLQTLKLFKEYKTEVLVTIYMIAALILVSHPPIEVAKAYVVYEEEWKWTLSMQVHAPRYGRAEGTTSWSVTTSFTITGGVGMSYTSSIGGSWTAYPEDGKCTALFRLCYWVHKYDPIIGDDIVCIEEVSNSWYSDDIYGSSRDTCEDDLETLPPYNGYEVIEFGSRYKEADWSYANNSETEYEHTVNVSYAGTLVIGPVEVELEGVVFTGSFEITSEKSMSYKYYFGPNHAWYADFLKDGNQECVWAFKLRW